VQVVARSFAVQLVLPASDLATFREVAHPEKFYKLRNRIAEALICSFFLKKKGCRGLLL